MNKEVKVFSSSWCSGCKTVKKVLDDKGIQYTVIDIDTEEGAALAQENKIRSIPVTLVGNSKYVGSSPDVIGLMIKGILGEISD